MTIDGILILSNHVDLKADNSVTENILSTVTFDSEFMRKINTKTEKS